MDLRAHVFGVHARAKVCACACNVQTFMHAHECTCVYAMHFVSVLPCPFADHRYMEEQIAEIEEKHSDEGEWFSEEEPSVSAHALRCARPAPPPHTHTPLQELALSAYDCATHTHTDTHPQTGIVCLSLFVQVAT